MNLSETLGAHQNAMGKRIRKRIPEYWFKSHIYPGKFLPLSNQFLFFGECNWRRNYEISGTQS